MSTSATEVGLGNGAGSPKTLVVKVQNDHLESLTRARDPLAAVAELIWNSLDADADRVDVRLIRNELDGFAEIEVADNGHGLPYRDGLVAFESLGGSMKRHGAKSPAGRRQHGQLGKGRFRAFAIGSWVVWETCYREGKSLLTYRITGRRESLGTFELSAVTATSGEPGTTVTIQNIDKAFRSFDTDEALPALACTFALYLRQYPNIRISFDGHRVDPSQAEDRTTDYELTSVSVSPGRAVSAWLTVIEWKMPTERGIYLCDTDGFSHGEVEAGIRASGYSFTAYLRSNYVAELNEAGVPLLELHEGLGVLVKAAREKLRAHFRKREAESASALVETWKRDDVYPYSDGPLNAVEQVERQVFDIVAVNVHSYLPTFDDTSVENKRLAFGLIRQALETNPKSLRMILEKVFRLPKEKQDDFARLLERTSLEAVIATSKLVADRLDFLAGLEQLAMDQELRQKVKERTQLHRIVAEQTWIFGEEFNITADDEDLTTVLRRNLARLKMEDVELLDTSEPVRRADGRRAIVDLMLSRRVPLPRDEERRHLVIELKRPSVKINDEAVLQVKGYAEAVANDPRFRGTNTEWSFWAVSTEMTESVRSDANQEGRPSGLLAEPKGRRYTVWVKTWGEIIQENQARLNFVKKQLQYRASAASGKEYLRETYERFIPKSGEAHPESSDSGELELENEDEGPGKADA